jgi:heme-degrading monooxygenase HmoA
VKTHDSQYVVIWEFQVNAEATLAFEQAYGPDGHWAHLFRQSPGFHGTQLLRDSDRPGRYLTLDHWTSRAALHQFKQAHQADYDAFDKQCESLTERESFFGEFESSSASPFVESLAPTTVHGIKRPR